MYFQGRWWSLPEDTADGRQPWHGRRELFRSNHVDENEVTSRVQISANYLVLIPNNRVMIKQGCEPKILTTLTGDFQMDTILRHCYVMTPDEYAKSGHEGDDVFMCGHEYDFRHQTFKRVADEFDDVSYLVSCDCISCDFEVGDRS